MRLVVPLSLLLLAAAPFVQAASFTVTAVGLSWSPSSLAIQPGDSVTFSFGAGSHTWVRDDAPDSCSSTCTRTFTEATVVSYHCGIHPSMTGTIFVGEPIALAITSPAAGATVSGGVTVTGTVSYASAPITSVTVSFAGASSVTANIQGTSWSAVLSTTNPLLADGPRNILAHATAQNGAFADAAVGVIIDNPDRVDLRVSSVTPQSSATQTNRIGYVVRNDGNAPSGGPFAVRAEYLYQGVWHAIGQRTHASIDPQKSASGEIVWDPDLVLVGQFTVRVIADATLAVPDADRANNLREASAGWFTSALPGIDPRDPL